MQTEIKRVLSIIRSAAADPSTDAAKFAKLIELRERVQQQEAKKAFNAAIAEAKSSIGPIFKEHAAELDSKHGNSRKGYRFEGFDTIARAVDPVLGPLGLAYRFRPQSLPEKRLRMTCILSHRDGYSEESSLEAYEDHSGSKTPIQAIGSACTYLQRYTLKAALGLAATTDTDAAQWNSGAENGALTEEQSEALQQRIATLSAEDASSFLRFLNVPRIDLLSANDFPRAMQALDQKARKLSESPN